MTKQAFKEAIKNGLVSVYGYTSTKQYEEVKQKNIQLKKDLQPLKKTTLSHIGSNWKDIDIDEYSGYITLSFNTNTTAYYKINN